MPVQFAVPPQEALDAVARQGERVAARPAEDQVRTFTLADGKLPAFFVLPSYSFGTTDILNRVPPRSYAISGWRFFGLQPDGQVFQSRVFVSPEGKVSRSASLTVVARLTAQSFQVISELRDRAEAIGDRYEARMLHIPSLSKSFIWLAAHQAADDRFVPIPPGVPGLDEFRLYTLEELYTAMKPVAERLSSQRQEAKQLP